MLMTVRLNKYVPPINTSLEMLEEQKVVKRTMTHENANT